MPLFRTRIAPAVALEKLFAAVTDHPVPTAIIGVPNERVVREQTYVALFAVLIALKFCRKSDWRNNGQDLFTALSARALNEKLQGIGPILDQAILSDRLQYYNLAIEIAASNPSPERFAAEIGKSFAMICGQEANARLATMGSACFVSTFNNIAEITSSYKLGWSRGQTAI